MGKSRHGQDGGITQADAAAFGSIPGKEIAVARKKKFSEVKRGNFYICTCVRAS
jgi:hypothetical protein